MADSLYFSKVRLPNGTEAEVCDEVARRGIFGGIHFIGVTTTYIADGAVVNPVEIGDQIVTAVNGDIVLYGNKEFIFSGNDSAWHEFGDTTAFGALALKDSVSASYTPEGTVSKPNVRTTPTRTTIRELFSAGSVTFGEIKEISSEGSVTNGTIKEFSTNGSVTSGTVKEVNSEGNVVAGTPNVPTAVVLPTMTAVLTGTTLELDWTPGSVINGTACTPTSVTLPTFKDAEVVKTVTMPVYKETSVVVSATMPTSKNTNVVSNVTMPTGKETSVITEISAELENAPEFEGTSSTIVSE